MDLFADQANSRPRVKPLEGRGREGVLSELALQSRREREGGGSAANASRDGEQESEREWAMCYISSSPPSDQIWIKKRRDS